MCCGGCTESAGGGCRTGSTPPRRNLVSPVRTPVNERPTSDVDALVTTHLPLARSAGNAGAARIALPSHVSRDDLLSCAHVPLVEVPGRYSPAAGATFSTYAL